MEELIKELEKIIAEGGELNTAQLISQLKSLDEKAAEDPVGFENYSGQLQDLFQKIADTPEFATKRFKEELSTAISDGAALYTSLENMRTARGQIRTAEEAAEALQAPALPSVTQPDVELGEATETARRRLSGRLPELDPILQRNLDLLQQGLGVAQTASAGQAAAFGTLGQQAVNEARRANLQAIPQIEAARRQDFSNYLQLLGQRQAEDRAIARERMGLYDRAQRRYLEEAKAAGQLGAVGQQNLALARQGLGQQLGAAISPLIARALPGAQNLLADIRMRRGMAQQTNLMQDEPMAPSPRGALFELDPSFDLYRQRIDGNLNSILT